jgi:hypothetical protein
MEYRRITRYLSELPTYVSQNPQVREAFLRFSGLAPAQATTATTLGQRPLFQVAPIQVSGAANGSYNRQTGIVTIDLVIGAEVEHQRSLSENLAKRLLYATCLHELVHFGRHVSGLPATFDGEEAGKLFECQAYQGDVGWDGQSSRLSHRRSGSVQGVRWACPLHTLLPPRRP